MNQSNYICEIIPVYRPKRFLGFKRSMSNRDAVKSIRKIITKEVMEHYEVFGALFLNSSLKVMGYNILNKGASSMAIVDIKLLFQNALVCNASRIIVFHNHPNGIVKPSFQDLTVTQKIKDAGKFLDIELVDSIIVTKNDNCSILEELENNIDDDKNKS